MLHSWYKVHVIYNIPMTSIKLLKVGSSSNDSGERDTIASMNTSVKVCILYDKECLEI